MRNKRFAFILVLALILGLVLLIRPQREVETLERRKASVLSEISPLNLSNDLDNVLSDQFIFRDNILKIYHSFKYFSSRILNPHNYLEAVDKGVINIGDDYLINNVYTNDYYKYVVEYASSRAYNIKELKDKYKDIDVYVYKPTRLEEKDYLYTDIANSPLLKAEEDFIKNLGEDVTYKAMELKSIEDYKNIYYRSDIHYNIEGSYRAYKDIIEMIQEKYYLKDALDIKDKIIYEYDFYGHYGNILGNITTPDHLEDYDLGIDESQYTYLEEGKITKISDKKNNYKENNTIYSAYDDYFLDNDGLRIFRNNEIYDPTKAVYIPRKPNILIFADSYINPIAEWLAIHFDNTVIIDLRNIEDFKLEEYIKEYNIDIILVYQYYENLYMNGNMYIPLN